MSVRERFFGRYFGPQGLIPGIRVCLSQDHTGTALALVCATIESMALLSLPDRRTAINEHDFASWVNRYLQPHKIGVDADELWSVRCALVNGFFTQYNVTREKKPREILFAWGGYSVFEGMQLRPGSRWQRLMRIRADELYKALARGAEEFGGEFISSPENAYLVSNRLIKIFGAGATTSEPETGRMS